jgi:hypothetical protein
MKKTVAKIPKKDLDISKLEDRADREEAHKALADVKKRGALPWDQVKKKKSPSSTKR